VKRWRPPPVDVDDEVRIRFRARWTGVVVALLHQWDPRGVEYTMALVQPTRDRTGRPQPRHVRARLVHPGNLELVRKAGS
jgi:hypothetical protein